ncbi:MAG: AsmA family protein [Prevotellaceae bacterium]|jgi:hypothetical protein|nr:AsmA family protein [Prevotellaceae bacterium]
MKKVLKITGLSLLGLVLLLLLLPFVFQGKIVDFVKKEANKQLNATLEFDKLSLSFIRNFPRATISLHDFSIIGQSEFEGDTLVFANKISVTVNLMSIFGSSGYEITKVLLDQPMVNAIVLVDGKANWDIMKASEDAETPVSEDTTLSSIKLSLKNLTINKANIFYRNEQAKMSAAINNLQLSLSGDMTAEQTAIKSEATIKALTFAVSGVPYLNKAEIAMLLNINADLKNGKYIFDKNSLRLNAIEAGINGWVAMLDEGYEMDVRLNTSKVDFKQLLSLIPAIYVKNFADLKASGNVQLAALAKGKMLGGLLPMFDVKLLVDNGRFQYPDLPKSVDNVGIDVQIANPGGIADLTTIDVRKFHVEMAGNPFNATMAIVTPVSDMSIKGAVNGKIDFNHLKEVYPLEEGTSLNGLLTASLNFSLKMSHIEKNQYENISAAGLLQLKDMLYKSANMPDVQIAQASLQFSPKFVELSGLNVIIGENDIAANGRLENFIPYLLADAILKGALNIKSNYLNLNDFMGNASKDETTTDTTSSMSAFVVPKNIDFTMTAKMNEVIFDKLHMKNTEGQIIVKDGKVDLKNFSTNAFAGTIVLNGYYSTAKDPKNPEVNMGIDIKNAAFAETFKSLDLVKQLSPIFENMSGIYSMKLNLNTTLNESMSPNLQSLAAAGLLQSQDVKVQNVTALNALAKALNNDKLSTLSIKDLKIDFDMKDGRVRTKPFDVNTGVGKLNLSGSTGFDQTIDYKCNIDLPKNTLTGTIGKLVGSATIKGTFKNPKVELNTKEMVNQAVDGVKAEANKAISEELLKQTEKIKEEAQKAGELLIAEAEKQGQRLIDEANKTTNALAKAAAVKAAEAAAQKLKDEAEKKAQQLNDEAEKQAQNLIEGAVIK